MSRTYKDRPARIRFEDHYKNRQDEYYTVQMIGYRYGKFEYVYTPGKLYSKKVFMPFDEPQVYEYTALVKKPGTRRKKKKADRTKWDWLGSEPSWWTRMFMNVPQRRKGRHWEREVVRKDVELLENEDPPGVSRKPKQYYW